MVATWQQNRERTLRGYFLGRRQLIRDMGGQCCTPGCGRKRKLQVHHLYRRTWWNYEVNRWVRLARWRREWALGLIDLRCGTCNRALGEPTEDAPAYGEWVSYGRS